MEKERVNWEEVTEKEEMELFFENVTNGIYEPLDRQESGVIYLNFFGFKEIKQLQSSLKDIPSDFLVEFAEVTGKKLGVHPAYLLGVLKKEIEDSVDSWKKLKSWYEQSGNKFGLLDHYVNEDIIQEDRYALQKIPEAMKKLLSKKPEYVS